MGWFKSAEEKEAEKRKEELIKKYGEKDGLRIYENKISEEKYLEEKDKKKKEEAKKRKQSAAKKKQTDLKKVLEYIDRDDVDIPDYETWSVYHPLCEKIGKKHVRLPGFVELFKMNFFANHWLYNTAKDEPLGYEEGLLPKGISAKKYVPLIKELINQNKLFYDEIWKGEILPDWFSHIMGTGSGEVIRFFTNKAIDNYKRMEKSIIDLLTTKSIKMTISDITAHLKLKNRELVKLTLECMHRNNKIDFAGSGRYFILSEEKKKPKKTSAPKSKEVDVEKELEKYKGLLDKGLITQEQYDAKSNELLGL